MGETVREVEDLLIECFYGGLLQGKLDQQAKQVEVHCTIGRDIHPSELEAMVSTLDRWHSTSGVVLKCLHEKLGFYQTQCELARNQQAELDQQVESIRTNLRAQQE